MDYFKIPKTFFEAIKQKEPVCQVLWMRWISYADELLKPEILEKLKTENPKVDGAVVRDIYNWGIPFMRDSLFSSPSNKNQEHVVLNNYQSLKEETEQIHKNFQWVSRMMTERAKESTDMFSRILQMEQQLEKLSQRDEVIERMAIKIGILEDSINLEEEEKDAATKRGSDKFDNFKIKENIVEPVLQYLNEKTGATYSAKGKKNRELILARIKEGFTLDDFKKVIDKKCAEWMKTDLQQYLRPITLFSITHFENYLNEPVKEKKTITKDNIKNIGDAVSKAAERYKVGNQ